MIKSLYTLTTILFLLLPTVSIAELSDVELLSIGKFLMMDYQTATDKNMKKPISNGFFVKETGGSVVITKNLILSIPSLIKKIRNKFAPGRYKGIIIISEIGNVGCVVREAAINEQKQIYWSDELQSLHRYSRRPKLGNTGVVALMDYENTGLLVDLFKNVKRGSLPNWRATSEELDWYLSTLDVFDTILINRP